MAPKLSRKAKNPPILSHEFVILNHGDIFSCIAVVFVMGLMFQITQPICSAFVLLQYDVTAPEVEGAPLEILYGNGILDLATVFFYTLLAIVGHAIIQEYVLDKVNRKLHLSKTKHSRFDESGQLFAFELLSFAAGVHLLVRDGTFSSLSSLWSNYPEDHINLSYRMKLYFLAQMAYWVHNYPELYFQKVKKEDMGNRIVYSTLHLVFIGAAYFLNFSRIALVLLTFHYALEAVLHASRMLQFAEVAKHSTKGFRLYNILFPVFRVLSLMLTILTFMMGLSSSSASQGLDVESGNYNTPLVRLLSVGTVSAIQGWMVLRFVTFHLRQKRAKKEEMEASIKKKQALAKAAKKAKKMSDDDVALLPEVDQNTRRRK